MMMIRCVISLIIHVYLCVARVGYPCGVHCTSTNRFSSLIILIYKAFPTSLQTNSLTSFSSIPILFRYHRRVQGYQKFLYQLSQSSLQLFFPYFFFVLVLFLFSPLFWSSCVLCVLSSNWKSRKPSGKSGDCRVMLTGSCVC